jgi:hypothetical protein
MANPITSKDFAKIAHDGLNKVFDDTYELHDLRLMKQWLIEAYPQVAKEYGYVKDAGFNNYE